MAWKLLDARAEFRRHADRWDALNRQHHASHPLLTAAFIEPLVDHFGDGEVVLAVEDDGPTCGAMALLEPERLGIWRCFSPSQAPVAPMVGAFERSEALAALMAVLPFTVRALDLLRVDPVYLRLPQHAGSSLVAESQAHWQTMAVEVSGTFDEYWGSRHRSLAKNMRRYRHRLSREALPFRLETAKAPPAVIDAVRSYGMIESQGWKARAGTALHPENLQGAFYEDVLTRFAREGGARVFSLFVGGELASVRLCVEAGGMLVILKTTYREAFRRFAVGRLLLQEMLRACFEDKAIRRVEFYTNASREQLAWATSQRSLLNVRYYRTTADQRVAWIARRSFRPFRSAET